MATGGTLMSAFYIVLLVVLALVAVLVVWDWWRTGRAFCSPIPRPYRERDSQRPAWRERRGEKLDEADAVLTMLCEAFGFNPDDRYKFGPEDRVKDVYQACYPRWKLWLLADSMETESLASELADRYGVEVEKWLWDASLGEITERIAGKQSERPTDSLQ